jgi:spermidine synthase
MNQCSQSAAADPVLPVGRRHLLEAKMPTSLRGLFTSASVRALPNLVAASTTDPLVQDARVAARIFAIGFALLLLGAAVGLNSWPGKFLATAIAAATPTAILLTLSSYSIAFAAIFWASRPSPVQQVAVLVGWAATTLALVRFTGAGVPPASDGAPLLSWPMFLSLTLAIPSLAALAWRLFARRADPTEFESRLRWLCGMFLLLILVPSAALGLTSVLHPQTFDFYTLHFDRAAGLDVVPALSDWVTRIPGLENAVGAAYGLTPVAFLAVGLLQMRGRPAHVASAILAWVVLASCALVAYHFLPVAGPQYIFGHDAFVGALRGAATQPLGTVTVKPYPRNGMPSMHFGWMLAASILWWQTGSRARSRAAIVGVTALTAIATLYLGEHYVVDLIVAVPFVLAALALSTTGVPWRAAERRRVVYAGFGCWLAWVLLLRWQIGTLVASPALARAMLVATALVVVYQVGLMRRFSAAVKVAALAPPVEARALPEAPSAVAWRRRFGALFFVSGAAALVYQVLFAKALALIFGSTAAATFTVLAVFLGGMAVGSLIGGALAHRSRTPLRLYAIVELGIGVYCAATPFLFESVQALYVGWASGADPGSALLLALRVALGAVVLLAPTVLMGVTLPLLAIALGSGAGGLGARVAGLYFANTAGAAFGSLVAAYALIPSLGVRSTTLMATLLNLMVALAALDLAKRVPACDLPPDGIGAAGPREQPAPPTRAAAFAIATLGLVGVLSLGLEVVYVHLLAIVAGNSVYAFGLMLATFLIGLATGGEGARRVLGHRQVDASVALAVAVVGLGAAVALGTGAWNAIPAYFASFEKYPLPGGFAVREAIRGLVCALAMVPPTIFIGAAYVFAIDIVTSATRRSRALALGTAAAVNTGGNIAGVLLFGFVLLPILGGMRAAQVVAATAVAWGLIVLVAGTGVGAGARRARGAFVWGAAAVGALAFGLGQHLDLEALSSGANVYFAPQKWGRVIDHAESVDGGLTTVAENDTTSGKVRTLLTNGKFQGNDALGGEMQAQVGFALAPLLHQPARNAALVIGYGTGVTSRVFHDAGFARLDIAELSADVVRLADQYFAPLNHRVSTLPGVHLYLTDGRNFLLLGQQHYDVVSIEITSIWFAGAASLYNEDFYSLVKARLAPGGVLQQWVQLHHLSPQDVLTIVATLRDSFRYVALYEIGGQGIVVATDDPAHAVPSDAAIARLSDSPQLAQVRTIAKRPVSELRDSLLLDAAGVDRFIGAFGGNPATWASTDDNLELEYSTPKANANDGTLTFLSNRSLLARYRQ